jgi:hypothetical protein
MPIAAYLRLMKRNNRRINRRGLMVWSMALALLAAGASSLPAEQSVRGAPVAELVAGMVAFDRAYIPALALSNAAKPEAALKAMTILKDQWSIFARQFGSRFPEAEWKQGFERTAVVLDRSEELVRMGDLPGAHVALEEVRDIFVSLRDRQSIPYYVDFLNRYHESMEEVTAVTAGLTAGTLEEKQVQQVGALLPEARRKWQATLDAPFDAGVYGFPVARADELRKAEEAVLLGIGRVEQALRSADREALVRTVEAMKPVFTKTFLMFGDFERVNR